MKLNGAIESVNFGTSYPAFGGSSGQIMLLRTRLINLFVYFILFAALFNIIFIIQDDSSKNPPSNASLRNNPSDSGSDVGTVVRPRAIDNTCLVSTSTVKVNV